MATSTIPRSMQSMIQRVKRFFCDEPRIGEIFENCFADTLQKTMQQMEDGTTFVITGDIPAMWLRDSTAQIRPYLLLAESDPEMGSRIEGVVRRQLRYVLDDPYANAFNASPNGRGHQSDLTQMSAQIWERKYEIDSLCYPIQLSYLLWKATGRVGHIDETFRLAMRRILETWRTEQFHETQSGYRFQRLNCAESDTLVRDGTGSPVGYTGMTWSGFRPSDDACHYGYLLPSNMFATVVLEYLEEISRELLHDKDLETDARCLANQLRRGIETYGTIEVPDYGKVYVYETDGLGRHLIMDDANVPSLLSMPYFGYCSFDDPVYLNTRRLILSEKNPYYYEGRYARGIGSPHTPERYIWPISLAIQGLTTLDEAEMNDVIDQLIHADAGCGMMHEGFNADNPNQFTRPWFSWANMMFCELVLAKAGYVIKSSPLAVARK